MPKKKTRSFLSQNFLVDEAIARELIDALDLSPRDTLLEIGPGKGFLTAFLLDRVKKLTVVEKDRRLVRLLKSRFGEFPGLEIVTGDFLDVELSALTLPDRGGTLRIIGMIPYHITTPILMHIITHRESVQDALLVVQREVARRVAASPGSKAFGSLSVAVQYWVETTLLFTVRPECFKPRPRVYSQAIHLRMREHPLVQPENPDFFFSLVRRLFTKRRKQLQKALRTDPILSLEREHIEALESSTGIDLGRRAEELSIPELAKLTDAVFRENEGKDLFHRILNDGDTTKDGGGEVT